MKRDADKRPSARPSRPFCTRALPRLRHGPPARSQFLLALIRRLSAPIQSPGTLRLLALYGPFTCQWHRWHVRNQYVPFIYVSRTWPFLLLRSYNSNPILSSHQLYTDGGPKPVRATSYLVCVLAGRKQCWLLNNSWQDCGNSTPSHCHR